MYFSGDSEKNYRDHMVKEDLLASDIEKWQTTLNESITLEEKNTSYINRDMVLGGGSSSAEEDHEGHNH